MKISLKLFNTAHETELNGPTVTTLKKTIKESITDRACLKLEVIAEEQNKYKEAWIEYDNIIPPLINYIKKRLI